MTRVSAEQDVVPAAGRVGAPTRGEPRAAVAIARLPDGGSVDVDQVGAAGNVAAARVLGVPARAGCTGPATVTPLRPRVPVRAKLPVTAAHDPVERAADAMAARVLTDAAPESAPAGLASEHAIAPTLGTDAPVGFGGADDAPPDVHATVANPGVGTGLAPTIRARIEAHVGVDLGGVRVHTDTAAQGAAAALGARAFTHGSDIFVGAGESASDLGLMAHEATHVAQQTGGAGPLARAVTGASLIPDILLDAVRAIPGYRLISLVVGEDLLTGAAVSGSRADIVQAVLGYGPFGGAVGPVLQALDILDSVVLLVSEALSSHNLTLVRVTGDIAAAWDEVDLTGSVDANVAIVRRYIAAFLTDVRACVGDLVDQVLAAVRRAAVTFAEPLVQTPEIKPLWDLAIKVFGHDPLRGQDVSAPTVEILADFLRLIGKEQALQQMQERGTLQQTADWLDTQLATFADLKASAVQLFADAWNAIAPENITSLLTTLPDLVQRGVSLVQRVAAFAGTVIGKVLEFVKQALLGWLSDVAHQTRGFHLLIVILGRDPFTGQAVERSAENLIKGFITLLPNGEQVYTQLAESGVIADAAGRIEAAITELNISWEMITGTFRAIWDALSLDDLLDPIGAFVRIVDQFGEPLGRIVSFAATVLQVVIELILKLMNFPSDLLGSIIANAMAAIDDIKRDPVQFLNNIVAALKQGVGGFLDNIGGYLLQGVAGWLFRGLGSLGITIPTSVDLQSIITLVLQVLGVSTETLWTKLGAKIGPENVVRIRGALDRLGQAWDFIIKVQNEGISAVWEFIQGQLSNLWDMLLTKAKNWVMTEIVQRVTTRLLSMLDPTGVMAVINSCVAFFNAVQSAIEYLREILEIVNRYVATIAAVAKGNITPGAQMLEGGLASSVPVAIGFLAKQVGLDNVPEKVVEIIQGLRDLVDQALDWLIDQAWSLGQAAVNAVMGGGAGAAAPSTGPAGPVAISPSPFTMDGAGHTLSAVESGGTVQVMMASDPGLMVTKIAAALASTGPGGEPHGGLPATVVTNLQAMSGRIAAFQSGTTEMLALYRQPSNAGMQLNCSFLDNRALTYPQFLEAASTKLASWARDLEQVGAVFGLKDLKSVGHRSRFVEGNSLKAEFRGDWRGAFYGGFVGGAGAAVRSAAFTAGTAHWQGLNPGARLPASPDLYRCAHCGDWFSSAGGVPGYPVRQLQVDHDETVVQHWIRVGRNVVQDTRVTWNSSTSNLQPMCYVCNGGGNPRLNGDYTVGVGFRGPNDAPPEP